MMEFAQSTWISNDTGRSKYSSDGYLSQAFSAILEV